MLLGGLWHGAGWTFVVWGAIHGLLLLLNHSWNALWRRLGRVKAQRSSCATAISRLLTFFVVAVAWVFFRAESFEGASGMLSAMFGGNGVSLPGYLRGTLGHWATLLPWFDLRFDGMFHGNVLNGYLDWQHGVLLVIILFFHSQFLPNTQEIVLGETSEAYTDKLKEQREIRVNNLDRRYVPLALFAGFLMAVSLAGMQEVSEFLYFQF
jgi:hypothetical protein